MCPAPHSIKLEKTSFIKCQGHITVLKLFKLHSTIVLARTEHMKYLRVYFFSIWMITSKLFHSFADNSTALLEFFNLTLYQKILLTFPNGLRRTSSSKMNIFLVRSPIGYCFKKLYTWSVILLQMSTFNIYIYLNCDCRFLFCFLKKNNNFIIAVNLIFRGLHLDY